MQKIAFLFLIATLGVGSDTTRAAEPVGEWTTQIDARRGRYLQRIIEQFSRLESSMKPLDGRAWSLNQARLFLNRDCDKASRYFESVRLTADPDFMGIRLLKTYLDFGETERLSGDAKRNLRGILEAWPMDRKGAISRRATWPPTFTENHDLMHLTIGLFSEKMRGENIESLLGELRRSLSWRFERGFYEWGSHRYQLHYSNPLLILAEYAPDAAICQGAKDLFSIMLAERALMSVGGYLGGPGMRSYGRNRGCDYLDNNRYDSFLPTVWLALGVGEPYFDFANSGGLEPAGDGYGNTRDPRLNQDEAIFLATANLVPHPIVRELLAEVETRGELVYSGRRAAAGHPFQNARPSSPRSHQVLYYYNTPHISMGSLQYLPNAGKMSVSYNSRPRFFSVMFPEKPEQVLRTRLSEGDLRAGPRSYEYRADRIAQHRNWLIAAGELSESHGLKSRSVNGWNVYRVGRGLCAHRELQDGWHVFQVADLDQFADEQSFVAALSEPAIQAGRAFGVALNGDRIQVDLQSMAVRVNGVLREPQIEMLHDSPWMRSEYGSGKITVRTRSDEVTFHNDLLRPQAAELPSLDKAQSRWGDPQREGDGATTNLAHVRAMGGMSPADRDVLLKSIAILVPRNRGATVRLAVYAGGSLSGGPHSQSPAKLLFDFGQTPKGQSGWVVLNHPTGVRLPANTPIWLAWKGHGDAEVQYQESPNKGTNFQRSRGRWNSRAIDANAATAWPNHWPADSDGDFDAAYYACFSTFERLR